MCLWHKWEIWVCLLHWLQLHSSHQVYSCKSSVCECVSLVRVRGVETFRAAVQFLVLRPQTQQNLFIMATKMDDHSSYTSGSFLHRATKWHKYYNFTSWTLQNNLCSCDSDTNGVLTRPLFKCLIHGLSYFLFFYLFHQISNDWLCILCIKLPLRM